MPLRTFALFDVIGIKRAIAAGKAANVLTDFWHVAEDWTNHTSSLLGPLRLADTYATVPADPIVRTYSDSALLTMPEEVDIDDFYKLLLSLKERIDQRAAHCYVIVNRDEEIPPPEPVVYVMSRGDPVPRYVNISGSGAAFPNLYLADSVVHGMKTWHGNYSVYCVGDESRPRSLQKQDERPIPGLDRTVIALK